MPGLMSTAIESWSQLRWRRKFLGIRYFSYFRQEQEILEARTAWQPQWKELTAESGKQTHPYTPLVTRSNVIFDTILHQLNTSKRKRILTINSRATVTWISQTDKAQFSDCVRADCCWKDPRHTQQAISSVRPALNYPLCAITSFFSFLYIYRCQTIWLKVP